MSDKVFNGWLRLRPAFRALTLLLICCISLAVGWWGHYREIEFRLGQRAQKILEQRQEIALRQQSLARLPSPEALQAQRQKLRTSPGIDGYRYPLSALVVGHEAQVQAWQPDVQPETLELVLSWQQFQRWYARLAALEPPLMASGLRLESHEQQLRVQLWVENDHAL